MWVLKAKTVSLKIVAWFESDLSQRKQILACGRLCWSKWAHFNNQPKFCYQQVAEHQPDREQSTNC